MNARLIVGGVLGIALSAVVLADIVKSYEGFGKTQAEACGEATNRAGRAGGSGLPSGASVGGCECSKDDSNTRYPWICIVRVTVRDR